MTKIKTPKKLIEVALPLDDINVATTREKSIRHGHPSTLHLWWARRPLAAARAVLFAQMVNDPGCQQGEDFKYGVNKKEAEIKREKLFQIIRDLVKWENTNNEEVLKPTASGHNNHRSLTLRPAAWVVNPEAQQHQLERPTAQGHPPNARRHRGNRHDHTCRNQETILRHYLARPGESQDRFRHHHE